MRELITSDNAQHLQMLTQVKHGWISHVEWAADGITLGIAGADGVRLYVGTFGGAPTHTLGGHEGHVKGMAFSPANETIPTMIASCSSDASIKLWDGSTLSEAVTEVATLSGHQDSVDAVAFTLDSQGKLLLASCSADGDITLYDVESRTTKAILKGHTAEVTSATFALGGNVLISGSWDKTVRLWDIGAETEGTIIGEHDDWVREVCTSPTGTTVASASKDQTVRLWDPHSGEMYALIQAHFNGADCVRFSPDGSVIATGGRDNVVRLWDVNTVLRKRKLEPSDAVMTLEGHEKPVLTLDFNRAGTLLATGSGDNTVKLWSIVRAEGDTPEPAKESQTAILDDDAE